MDKITIFKNLPGRIFLSKKTAISVEYKK